jgi:hypothetical protein
MARRDGYLVVSQFELAGEMKVVDDSHYGHYCKG